RTWPSRSPGAGRSRRAPAPRSSSRTLPRRRSPRPRTGTDGGRPPSPTTHARTGRTRPSRRAALRSGRSSLSPFQDCAGADTWRSVDMGEPEARATGGLPVAGLAAQLGDYLVDLTQSGGSDRLAVGQAAAVGVD